MRYWAITKPTDSGFIELHIYRVGESELIGVTQSVSDSVMAMVAMVRDYLLQLDHQPRQITIHHQVFFDAPEKSANAVDIPHPTIPS